MSRMNNQGLCGLTYLVHALNLVEVRALMSDYFPLFHEAVITYPCPNHNAGVANPR